MKVEVWSLLSAYLLIMLCICTKFHENIPKGFKVIERTRFPIFKFSKGNNSVNNVGGVMVSVLCTSSDDPLYLYKV